MLTRRSLLKNGGILAAAALAGTSGAAADSATPLRRMPGKCGNSPISNRTDKWNPLRNRILDTVSA